MLKHVVARFGIRWVVSSLGLWIAASILGTDRMTVGDGWATVIFAGFFLALINMALKPLLVILSFPAIILSLGLFMIVVNGFLIIVVSWIYPTLYIKNFGVAMVVGIIVGFVNFLVSQILESK